MRVRRLLAIPVVLLCASTWLAAFAPAATASRAAPRALLVFVDPGQRGLSPDPGERVLAELAAVPGMSVGLLSATQGGYSTSQFLLDLTAGTRTSRSVYSPKDPPRLDLAAGGAGIGDWQAVLRRAGSAPQAIEPGLLASAIPGGGAYAGLGGERHADAVAAADARGRLAASIGAPQTLAARVARLAAAHAYVVADLPPDPAGVDLLRKLAAARRPGQLLIAIQRAPDAVGNELLWIGVDGVSGGGAGGELTSASTNLPGVVAAIDIAPTILRRLGVRVPSAMRGRPISSSGRLDVRGLRSFRKRLTVINGRRFPAIEGLLLAWLALALAAGALGGWGRTRPAVLRLGALAVMWAPLAVLIDAALGPGRLAEQALLIALCFALAALTDRLLPWPRGPALPAAVGFLAVAIDAAAGTHLLVRSLLGPNPAFGARFYGIGNELKSGLTVLVLVGVAAALAPAVRSRRNAAIMAGAGVVLGVVIGSGRLGAGVGGVILVAAGTGVATVLLLPGALTRVRIAAIALAPLVALVALAAIDLATAGGRGHYTHDVIEVRSAANLHDIVVRRYALAFDQLKRKDMLIATALGLLAVAWALRNRLLATLPDPAWRAAMLGGLAAGVVGALTEDSGPMLFIVATFTLACVAAYLRGAPAGAPGVVRRPPAS